MADEAGVENMPEPPKLTLGTDEPSPEVQKVNDKLKTGYETALRKPSKHTAPPKPAKTNYQPFHW